jgi:hypothetical protein
MDSLTFCSSQNNSTGYQSGRGQLRYGYVHLLPTIVKNNSISHQSSRNTLKYGWVHLQAAIVNNNSVSHQSCIMLQME